MAWTKSSGARRQRVAPAPRVRHGLRPEQVSVMLRNQGNACLICGSEITERTLVIDHDHALAAIHGHPSEYGCPQCVRGLLDAKCNALLGFAKDSPETLRRAATYVELARQSAR